MTISKIADQQTALSRKMLKESMNHTEDFISHKVPQTKSVAEFTDITLEHEDGNVKVDWKTVPEGYDVVFCQGTNEITSKKVQNPPATIPAQSLYAGKYLVKVRACSQASDRKKHCQPRFISLCGDPKVL